MYAKLISHDILVNSYFRMFWERNFSYVLLYKLQHRYMNYTSPHYIFINLYIALYQQYICLIILHLVSSKIMRIHKSSYTTCVNTKQILLRQSFWMRYYKTKNTRPPSSLIVKTLSSGWGSDIHAWVWMTMV